MSPTRIQSKLQPIELDLAPAFFFEQGFGRAELLQFGPQLERVRAEVLAAGDVAASSPINWPERALNDYRQHRKNS
jgi:hypothetical protein